jgi:SpoIID/LytB domain protein
MMEMEPTVTVGIVSGEKIKFALNKPHTAKGEIIEGEQTVEFCEGAILWNGNQYRELSFAPKSPAASFSLYEVSIGRQFHWERKQTQTFTGVLRLVVEADKIVAINQLPVEDYLASVISSEMKATSSLELLKAHAVISRSWLLAQMERRKKISKTGDHFFSFVKKEDEIIRWYDREDHAIFDVCADDHCQRYQGITTMTDKKAAEAVKATRGQVLAFGGEICDARFSKCCGGVTEEFQYCWDNIAKPYLRAVGDYPENTLPDLRVEQNARKWIMTQPKAYCNTRDREILTQVLNDYDTETTDFYRWTVVYTQEQLAALLAEKVKVDFGGIKALQPVERGRSGRISRLRIVGTKCSLVIGKELEIRRALSETHLLSSAFVVDTEDEQKGLPGKFILHGAGWGHGVGLCQIGAAVMGQQGKSYEEILLHYYRDADIKRLYK